MLTGLGSFCSSAWSCSLAGGISIRCHFFTPRTFAHIVFHIQLGRAAVTVSEGGMIGSCPGRQTDNVFGSSANSWECPLAEILVPSKDSRHLTHLRNARLCPFFIFDTMMIPRQPQLFIFSGNLARGHGMDGRGGCLTDGRADDARRCFSSEAIFYGRGSP